MNEIQAALAALEPKGDFYTQRMVNGSYLQINVNKIGRLVYPLTTEDIESLIALAEPAKYGLKEQTILDESVRKVWEIKPTKFKILKTLWRKGFEPLLDGIRGDLGLPDETRLSVDLHNMLVYEAGCFFKPHQDSEKVDNMVATMVVVLPTKHSGGELVVEHNGRSYTFDSAKESELVQAFSFYADCRHEVKPLKSGYRVVLTFNLILENYKGQINSLTERDFDKRVDQAIAHYFSTRDWLPSWRRNEDEPLKFVYLLDHEYTKSGLSWQHLKNADRMRVEALLKAADKHQLDAYLTLVDSHETWDCYDENDDYYSRKRRRYYYDEDEDEESEEANYVLNDIIDSETTIEYWLDRQGNHRDFNSCYVDDCYVHATVSGEDFTPYDSEYEGFMGNYGNTMDRWYKRAAIVMWQKKDAAAILFAIDPLSYINTLYQPMRDGTAIDKFKTDLYAQLDALENVWSAYVKKVETPEQYRELFQFVSYIADKARAKTILENFGIKLIAIDYREHWHGLSDKYGAQWLIEVFSKLIEKERLWDGFTDFPKLIKAFHQISIDKEVLRFLFSMQLQRKVERLQIQLERKRERVDAKSIKLRHDLVSEFINVALNLEDRVLHDKVIDVVLSRNLHLDSLLLVDVLERYFPLSKEMRAHYDIDRIVSFVRLALEEEKNIGVRDENDWCISFENSCKCELCDELGAFLHDKNAQSKTWPIAESKRQHVSSMIYDLAVPVKLETLRKGSPHKLVLTKDDGLYATALKRYQKVSGALAQLCLDFNIKEGAI
ncbi:2OG-Fe(II) oxygenase [Cysteiniphilum halobium]|uniref:2OG-Fe(II) oxygenase n=1 Tax=Cysteiniphilum halobium TaxID=2219059 RepID=UPI0013C2FAC7|nr:2OG-Fe(II) oxygenase [Cysteiniphilum halobium]